MCSSYHCSCCNDLRLLSTSQYKVSCRETIQIHQSFWKTDHLYMHVLLHKMVFLVSIGVFHRKSFGLFSLVPFDQVLSQDPSAKFAHFCFHGEEVQWRGAEKMFSGIKALAMWCWQRAGVHSGRSSSRSSWTSHLELISSPGSVVYIFCSYICNIRTDLKYAIYTKKNFYMANKTDVKIQSQVILQDQEADFQRRALTLLAVLPAIGILWLIAGFLSIHFRHLFLYRDSLLV